MFYGPGSTHTATFLRAARWHVGLVAGRPGSYASPIHLHDAAAAVVAALGAPAGTYNVFDDRPVTKRELAAALGEVVGKRPWLRSPGSLSWLAGKSAAALARSQRVSNGRLRAATGWVPRYPSVHDGLATAVGDPEHEVPGRDSAGR